MKEANHTNVISKQYNKDWTVIIHLWRRSLRKRCYEPFRFSLIESDSFCFNVREGLVPSIRDEVMAKRVAEETLVVVLSLDVLLTFFMFIK